MEEATYNADNIWQRCQQVQALSSNLSAKDDAAAAASGADNIWPRGQQVQALSSNLSAKDDAAAAASGADNIWPRGQQVQALSSNLSAKDDAAAAASGPVTIDNSGGLGDLNFWAKKMGCNICKEARYLCSGCKNCNYEKCGNCATAFLSEEMHNLFKNNSYDECICHMEGLELLFKKKEAIKENRKLVHSLYLRREQNSLGERYDNNIRRRYGCLQPDFIWVIFRKFMNPIPDIPPNYISDWPQRLIELEEEAEREEEEDKMWQHGFIRCPCGCPYWIHWSETLEYIDGH